MHGFLAKLPHLVAQKVARNLAHSLNGCAIRTPIAVKFSESQGRVA